MEDQRCDYAKPRRAKRRPPAEVYDPDWLRRFPQALLSVPQIAALAGITPTQAREFLRKRGVIEEGVGRDNSKEFVAPADLMEKVPGFWKSIVELRIPKLIAEADGPVPAPAALAPERFFLVIDNRVVEIRNLTSVGDDRVAFETDQWIDPCPDPMRTYQIFGTDVSKHYVSHVVEARAPDSTTPKYTAVRRPGRVAEC